MSNKIKFNPDWMPGEYESNKFGWLEGNVVVNPQGKILNILRCSIPLKVWRGHETSDKDKSFNIERYKACSLHNKAAIINVEKDGALQTFGPVEGFIDFPGGTKGKFTIRRDPQSGLYISLVNADTDPECSCSRNVLSLSVSKDLFNWRVVKKLLEDDTGLDWEKSCALTGFQYVDWQFDGDDIIYLVRMGYRGAHTYHDSNRISFHRLENFRNRCDFTLHEQEKSKCINLDLH